jgi:hypothetical protein
MYCIKKSKLTVLITINMNMNNKLSMNHESKEQRHAQDGQTTPPNPHSVAEVRRIFAGPHSAALRRVGSWEKNLKAMYRHIKFPTGASNVRCAAASSPALPPGRRRSAVALPEPMLSRQRCRRSRHALALLTLPAHSQFQTNETVRSAPECVFYARRDHIHSFSSLSYNRSNTNTETNKRRRRA